ncbi:hypothetical protein TVAG_125780 [Trichomonas vaginalis G3]|uniref:Uncharacterized protein n=1 Tax=Trichomonas vaginalis (strain ATCC PRA-98 / G3) TaxID=412133 RepID=A2ET85_TRIV3|nr:spectrin binding [Trichomonas vaginalis G3]EAY04138.1 hypothetical protein TVAG_125780 [Trichomonas vaginalis G3]KAI5549891.1 spectrin binding [Trichomonas vaginalis G3]|eukprot:XP_001316361.1 hypothetical protein [Trichomonas vaginalis G3]
MIQILQSMRLVKEVELEPNLQLLDLIFHFMNIPILNLLLNEIKKFICNTPKSKIPQLDESKEIEEKSAQPTEKCCFKPIDINSNEGTFLQAAKKGGNIQLMEEYMSDPNFDIYCCGTTGNNAMMLAALEGNVEIIKMLHKHGMNMYKRNADNLTAFHIAAIKGNLDVIKYFVSINFNLQCRANNLNGLELAILNNNMNIVQYFLEELDFEPVFDYAVAASSHGKRDILTYLNRFNIFWEKQNILLNIAASKCNLDAINYFIDDLHFDVNSRDQEGRTPLMIAALTKQEEAVDLLIEKKADINMKSDEFKDAFYYAVESGSTNIVCKLFINNAKIENINQLITVAKAKNDEKMVRLLTNDLN